MSLFIQSIEPGVGFKLNPPVSYTTPLPTNTIGCVFLALLGLYSIIVNVGGSIEPLFTANRPPIFNDSICVFSKTCTWQPTDEHNSLIFSLNCTAFK